MQQDFEEIQYVHIRTLDIVTRYTQVPELICAWSMTICVSLTLITLRACTRGKAISSIVIATVIIIVIVDTKLAKSGYLGTFMSGRCNKSIEFGEILPLVFLECAF